MSDKFSLQELQVEEWLKKASEDEQTAKLLLKEGGLPNPICFLSQQAVEKYLKAFLVTKQRKFPKIHTLDKLLKLCIAQDSSFNELEDDVIFLSDFYVATRYPGDYPTFSMKDAKEAYEAALRVKDLVLGKIK